ncbi:MAG: 2-amino-4-hydroxy-6-hydroxymethyldihydropteridine diphosphokinase [Bacteroidales bacterium]
MREAIILLGSNMGERYRQLDAALRLIGRHAGEVVRYSSIYESEPWGFQNANNFLNQVVAIDTGLVPRRLLETLQAIEDEMGKKRVSEKEAYSSRVIDIDILFYRDEVIETESLTIPHKLLHRRRFTLLPLNEIAADLIHPVFKKTIRQLLDECPDNSQVYRVESF